MIVVDDYWFWQRHDDALFDHRESEGRCGQCGAYKGRSHVCPHIIQLQKEARRDDAQ